MYDNIDEEKLRDALVNYFGTAQAVNPDMMPLFLKVTNCSKEELINIANENNISLDDFKIKTIR